MSITGKKISYEDLAPLLKTGDIVLFQGDSMFQKVLNMLTGSPYNHVAMIVLSKDLNVKSPMPPILLWESTPFTFTDDEELHKPKTGPTLVDLETRLSDEIERGTFQQFVFRRLSNSVSPKSITELNKAIRVIYPEKFPSDLWFFIKGIIGRLFNIEERHASTFCSELIGYTYQKMGLISTKHPPDYYWPKNFSTDGVLDFVIDESLGENLILESGTVK